MRYGAAADGLTTPPAPHGDVVTGERARKATRAPVSEAELAAARREGEREVRESVGRRILEAELRAQAARAGFADPDDAVALIVDTSGLVDVFGEPDPVACRFVVTRLLMERPELRGVGQAGPLPGGGGRDDYPGPGLDRVVPADSPDPRIRRGTYRIG